MKKNISLILASIFCISIATAQIDRSKRPVAGPAPKIQLTQPSTFTLKNGLKVLVVENHKLPAVRVQLQIDNPMHANGTKAGVESLLSQMLGNGTANISKDAFNEEVDFLGARINFGSESAYASSLSEYFPRIIELMADAIKNPLFDQAEFDKEKAKAIDGLKTQEKSVSAAAKNMRDALTFGKDHPKGEFTSIEKVENLKLADVKSFFYNYFSPKNAYLVVVGDVKTKDVEKLVRENLSDWSARPVPVVKYTEPKDAQYTQVNFVDMPNAVQSEIAVTNLVNLKMGDPDYHAVLVANSILGGGFNSLLNMNLREANGWTYGARSSTGADKNVTRFMATTSVRNSVTDSAVVETLKEIRFIRDNKVTPQQLSNAKAKFTGDFVLALERPETVANYALRIKTQNLSDNFYVDYLKKINAVTAEDVMRVAKKYYRPDNLRVIVVGKGSEVLPALKTLKGPTGKSIPVTYFDKNANPVAEPDYNKSVGEGVTAESVLEAYLKAIGGRKVLEGVTNVTMQANAEMQGMKLGLEVINTNKSESSLIVSMMGSPLQKVVFDGEKGYMESQGQRIDYTAEQNAEAKNDALPFMELDLKDAKLDRIENIDGKDAYVLTLGKNKQVFYDKETGLKVRQESVQEVMGQSVTSTTNFSDYKETNGIKFPYAIGQVVGPQELVFKIENIVLNQDMDDAKFK